MLYYAMVVLFGSPVIFKHKYIYFRFCFLSLQKLKFSKELIALNKQQTRLEDRVDELKREKRRSRMIKPVSNVQTTEVGQGHTWSHILAIYDKQQ